jgi:hypothetical protein
MDIKNRVKSVKEKLKDLGYEVKHTHCQEVLAAAHGERNFHTLKAKEEGDSPLTKALDVILPEKNKEFVMGMGASSIREEFEEMCRAVHVSLSPVDYKKIIQNYKLIEDGVLDEFGFALSFKSSIKNTDPTLIEEGVFDNDFIWKKPSDTDYSFAENTSSSVDFHIKVCKFGLIIQGETDQVEEQRLTFEGRDYISIEDLKSL